jgi:streptogramin lyase
MCTVNVTFSPKYAGARYGAVVFSDATGVIGTAYLYGTGQGPQLVFPSNTIVQTLGGGFLTPPGVAVDGRGNVYAADPVDDAVKEMPPACASSSCVTVLGGGFQNPNGVAVDGSGNVYVADTGNSAVKEMPPGCTSASCVTTLGGGFSFPTGVAVDGIGNVYVADTGNSAVKEMPPWCASSTCVTLLGGGFDRPAGVAVDGGGNVYVADYFNSAYSTLKEMPAGCGSSSCVTTLPSGTFAFSVALDGSGNIYTGGALTPRNSEVEELNVAAPPSLIFANTNVIGVEGSDSPKTATLKNIGNAPLSFPVPLTGENPSVSANFTLDSSTTCPEVLTSGEAGTLAAGASCELAVDFVPTTTGNFSGSLVLTDNNLNASPAVTQSIGLSGAAGATPIVPYIQDYELDGGAWQNVSSLTVNYGDTVNLGPQPVSGGSWSWGGPNGFTSSSRQIDGIPLTLPSNVFTATYTNPVGVTSTETFTIAVAPTTITPYIEVNGGVWQATNSVTVAVGSTVNLGPQPGSGGTWSWSGPGGFSSSARQINVIPLSEGANTYVATYTNPAGVTSVETFTITVE